MANVSPAALLPTALGSSVLARAVVSALSERPSHPAVRFTLPSAGPVTVTLVNAAGRFVWRLEIPQGIAGENAVVWDGRTVHGMDAPAGVYLARVQSPGASITTRVFLMR